MFWPSVETAPEDSLIIYGNMVSWIYSHRSCAENSCKCSRKYCL